LDIIPLRLEGYTKEIINLTQRIVDSIQENYAISISEYSKQDLLNYNKHIKPENIFVAPLAASPSTFYQNKNVADWQRVQKKYNLPTNYFLCISSSDIRKNIEHLIICFSQFILQEKPNDAHLVIAGNSTHSRTVLDKLNIDKEVRKRIVFPEKFIDESDLAIVYSNALSFFFMSLYEGFGLPALEAMQCGTPTVAANTSSIPEVMGDAGILLSPTDKNSLCETMLQLYNNESLRLNLSQKGIQQASLFSWERTANEYSSIFKMINNI
jgi:glycosyltransferase involved in cell wall biosynthesis